MDWLKFKSEIEFLKALKALLQTETDRRSRQMILAEAAVKLAEVESELRRVS